MPKIINIKGRIAKLGIEPNIPVIVLRNSLTAVIIEKKHKHTKKDIPIKNAKNKLNILELNDFQK